MNDWLCPEKPSKNAEALGPRVPQPARVIATVNRVMTVISVLIVLHP